MTELSQERPGHLAGPPRRATAPSIQGVSLRHLQYFVAVAEELHFGRAAQRLFISQPPLSHAIRQLEDQLGVQLLQRDTRKVEITPAGRAMLREARRLLLDLDEAVSEVRRIGDAEDRTRPVAVGGVPELTSLMPALGTIVRAGAGLVDVRFEEHPPLELASRVRHGSLECAVAYLPVEDATLLIEPLAGDHLLLAVDDQHPLARRASVGLEELQGAPMVDTRREDGPAGYDARRELLRAGGVTTDPWWQVWNLHAALAVVQQGDAVALLPGHARLLAPRGVAFVLVEDSRQTLALVRRHGPSTALTELIGQTARAEVERRAQTSSPGH